MVVAEIEAAQLSFASNRLALQRMTPMYPAMEELVYAAIAVRSELIKAGDNEQQRRCSMNNVVMAAQLQDRIYRYNSIEWIPSEAEVQADPRGIERLSDVSFLAGLNALRSAFEGTSGACSFLDWKTMSHVRVDDENGSKSEEYCRLEQTTWLIEDFLSTALPLFEQFEICENQQKEGTYQKRLQALGNDDRKAAVLRLAQTKLRAQLSNLKAALRNLPLEQLKSASMRVLMPFHQKSAANYAILR
ncbi:MAG: hypothetical protein P4L53_08905 [Candidatus Obscuribacterales bacterium]|nr:hypothetical protein [Candidatus Obscuribacterales bacterium]